MTAIDLAAQADLPEEEARLITGQIRDSIRGAWQLISRAYEGRVWLALGYETWDSYLAGEFGAAPLRLPREERPVVVASLRDAGMTTRAIAAATGLSKDTVSRTPSGVSNETPDAAGRKVTGLDGKRYSRTRPPAPSAPPIIPPRSTEGPPPAPLPTPPIASDEELDAQFEQQRAATASRFRANWADAVARAGQLQTFDLDRAVDVCDRRGLELEVRSWKDWAAKLEQRLLASPHLRVVGGDDG